jgi:hypothetical protein
MQDNKTWILKLLNILRALELVHFVGETHDGFGLMFDEND